MAVIRIAFPKIGHADVTTWVADEEWDKLSRIEREQLIYRFVKNNYQDALARSKQDSDSKNPNYRWNTV